MNMRNRLVLLCLRNLPEPHPQISLNLERKMPLKPARLFASFCLFFFQKEKEEEGRLSQNKKRSPFCKGLLFCV
jgi:hypothetical protein